MNFIAISVISTIVIAITCLLTYEIYRTVWVSLPKLTTYPRLRVLLIMIPIFTAHILNIWLYAMVYLVVENFSTIGELSSHAGKIAFNYESFLDCLYFSAATYTSLGFGDIVPTKDLRMLCGAEVLNGLVMIGWTVSITYLAMERFWRLPHGRKEK